MQAVSDYLLELRKKWASSSYTTVRINQIESRILAVTGIVDLENTKLNGSSDNIILSAYEIPVIGEVSE